MLVIPENSENKGTGSRQTAVVGTFTAEFTVAN